MELDPEIIATVELDDEGLDAAVFAATDYDRAGKEPREVLEQAIKAYILASDPEMWALRNKARL